ncbi:hypothetical protein PF002_g32109 [Phytophthora fragariae]|uniref:Uncharacterized protein n=1 Tax=Phytophthora fragariae TaxID=53985 RepID=A0A6A3PGW5_9STRA|nr:hypothetical protein PF003_g14008 [Phytophthora fragariae]KAE8902009.1 hypothetical protein PF003_g14006 [Phytophthora fragariae]KAE8902103.1 hypothetical protein PF003_g14009 [Phytophthora fragariae]KAE8902104.1 hypothetical protein PF003_g14007 [Phytophthora fragariae]KAE8917445.1 hypothetical protein PF009_g32233 [Phytophthora fragariae]
MRSCLTALLVLRSKFLPSYFSTTSLTVSIPCSSKSCSLSRTRRATVSSWDT